MDVIGRFEAEIRVADRIVNAKFYVMKGEGKTLIGRDTAIQLAILKLGSVNEISDEIAEFPKIKGVMIVVMRVLLVIEMIANQPLDMCLH